MPRRMNFLNQLWPDIFMDSIFSELIPGNSTPLEPGATGPLPFLTHIYHPVQQLSYIIILVSFVTYNFWNSLTVFRRSVLTLVWSTSLNDALQRHRIVKYTMHPNLPRLIGKLKTWRAIVGGSNKLSSPSHSTVMPLPMPLRLRPQLSIPSMFL